MATKVVFKSHIRRAQGVSRVAWAAGLNAIKGEIETEIQQKLAIQTGDRGPPAPKFKPPRRRSGDLQSSIKVVVRKGVGKKAATLEVQGNAYSRAQEFGRPEINMGPHPYARVVMLAGGRRGTKLKKKWVAKITRAARQASGSNRSKRRR